MRCRWPWMSKDAHEQIVAPLQQRVAELEIERKRLTDTYLAALGGERLYFPDVRTVTTPAADDSDAPDAKEMEEAELKSNMEYLARLRPSSLAQNLSRMMREGRRGFMNGPEPGPVAVSNGNGKAKPMFDQAEAEVKEKHGT